MSSHLQIESPLAHLLETDPLNLTAEDITLIVQHFRASRISWEAMEAKPKTVTRFRGPAASPEKTEENFQSAMADLKAMLGIGSTDEGESKP